MTAVPSVEIYTKPVCPYCDRAKHLLRAKGLAFKEIDISSAPGLAEEMVTRAMGKKTVPQIFINGMHVGGCDDLYALEKEKKLDPLLK